MKFPYRQHLSVHPNGIDFRLLQRPEIPVTIAGPLGSISLIGLVDTGSDNTVLPRSVAEYLGVPLQEVAGATAKAFGGFEVELELGEVTLAIEAEGETIAWHAAVFFHESSGREEVGAILGHAGFLDFFTAIFTGDEGVLSLTPNPDLPRSSK